MNESVDWAVVNIAAMIVFNNWLPLGTGFRVCSQSGTEWGAD